MNKVLYYILNLTWGLPMNIIGGLVALVMLITGHKPLRHGGCIYFKVGHGWGGMSLGLFTLCGHDSGERVKNHEFGHSIQNAMFGIFMIPLSIGSVMRYWYREIMEITEPPYDSWWFEGQATRLGDKWIK